MNITEALARIYRGEGCLFLTKSLVVAVNEEGFLIVEGEGCTIEVGNIDDCRINTPRKAYFTLIRLGKHLASLHSNNRFSEKKRL